MAQQTKAPKREEAPLAEEETRPGLETRIDGLAVKSWVVIGVVIAAVVIGFGAWWVYGLGRTTGIQGMGDMPGGMPQGGMTQGGMPQGGMTQGGMPQGGAPRFPAVVGFYEGQQVLFAHTEASDPGVADMLTDMMGSPVLVVPELADVPDSALGKVYVFANGIRPQGATGPFGFQPDVFDSAPGGEDYTPLRAVVVVRWNESAAPRILRSAAEMEEALNAGEIALEESGAVVNMPFLTWPGGKR